MARISSQALILASGDHFWLSNPAWIRDCRQQGVAVLPATEVLHVQVHFVHLPDDSRILTACLARLILAEHLRVEGDDALDSDVAGGSACREIGQQGADDLEMGVEVDPVDGEDMLLALVIDPGGGEAGISAKRLERLLPDHMVREYLVQQGGPVLDVVVHILNVRLVEAISHSLQSCISFASVITET